MPFTKISAIKEKIFFPDTYLIKHSVNTIT